MKLPKWAWAVVFLGAVILCVVACVHVANEWKAIQGVWITVSVEPQKHSYPPGSEWDFDARLVDLPGGYRCHYSINPLFRTIEYGGGGGTYELNGNELKIWTYENKSQTLYVLKRAGSPRQFRAGQALRAE
jgi:hypothetical protein